MGDGLDYLWDLSLPYLYFSVSPFFNPHERGLVWIAVFCFIPVFLLRECMCVLCVTLTCIVWRTPSRSVILIFPFSYFYLREVSFLFAILQISGEWCVIITDRAPSLVLCSLKSLSLSAWKGMGIVSFSSYSTELKVRRFHFLISRDTLWPWYLSGLLKLYTFN